MTTLRDLLQVVVVEGHVAFGEALCQVLTEAGYPAEHVERPSDDLLARIEGSPPGVVVVGLTATGPRRRHLELIATARRAGIPTIGLVADGQDPDDRGLLLRAGSPWVIGRDQPLARFVEVVTSASAGEVPEPEEPGPRTTCVEDDERAEAIAAYAERLDLLSDRERAVLEHLGRGRTAEEIARHDGVPASVVRTETQSVLRKLEVSSGLAAAAVLVVAEVPDSDA